MKHRTTSLLGAAAATGAALAGAYYFYGSDRAEKHRRELRDWANRAEKEIVSEARKLKKKALTDENIQAIITEVAKRYESTKNLDSDDVRDFVARMQSNWKAVKKSFTEQSGEAKRGKQRKPKARKTARA